MHRAMHTTRLGFSLIEMLVVVSIIAIVMALSFPMIGAMRRDSSVSAGINTIAVAGASIRRYATEDISFPGDLLPDNPAIPATLGSQGGLYSGAAAIFTPAGEIRLTKNDAGATSLDYSPPVLQLLERHGPRFGDPQGANTPSRELNGFEDIPIDYILLPSDTGVVGINRVSGGNIPFADPTTRPPLLLPPPFAIWFDQNGYMVATGWDPNLLPAPGQPNDYQFVYYDGEYDNDINVDDTTPNSDRNSVNNYNPDEYNPNHADFISTHWDDDEEKYKLPFDKLEAVVGVYVYSMEAFEAANDSWEDGITDNTAAPHWVDSSGSANDTEADNQARWEWLRKNGHMLMFSKQTGTLMRNRDE